jgi:hypothetical protein
MNVMARLKIQRVPTVRWIKARDVQKGDYLTGFGVVVDNAHGSLTIGAETLCHEDGSVFTQKETQCDYHSSAIVEVYR